MKIQMPEKAADIIHQLYKEGYSAYAVGGCIRDSILGKTPSDWDITTSALPEQVKSIFPRTVDTGIQHGTVTVLMGKEAFEVTTYRIDGEYEDNRHPKEVAFTNDLIEDLKRRDFTINAMAYNEEQGLVDVFQGREDLKLGRIRCVGDAKERFREDALRILRGIRFAAQLGFVIETETQEAMKELAGTLEAISAERIQVELVKLLTSEHPDFLELAMELGVTNIILPEFDRMMGVEQHNPHHIYTVGMHTLKALSFIENDKALRLAMLLHDVGKPDTESVDEEGISHFYKHAERGEKMADAILRRLKFDNDTRQKVIRLIRWHDYRFQSDMKGVRRGIYKIGEDIFLDVLRVMRADVLAQSTYLQQEKLQELDQIGNRYQEIKEREECLSIRDLAVNGNDLMAAGVPKGKEIGRVLGQLLELVLEEPDWNKKELLLQKVTDIWP